jgi:hypothetical protein
MPFTPRLALPTGLEVPRRIDPAGLDGPTAGQARGPHWVRVGKNRYRPAHAAAAPEQRILDAAGQLPDGGAVTGWAALRLHGAAYFDGRLHLPRTGWSERPVLLSAGRREGRRAADGVLFTYEPLPPEQVVVLGGVRATRADRALFDELRSITDPRRALVAAEMAVAARVVSLDAARGFAEVHRSWRRSLRTIAVLERARPGARSPKEVELRQVCELDAGLPQLAINVPVFDLRENFLLEADLLEPGSGLVVEFNGADHDGPAVRARDAERDDLSRRHGLELTVVVGSDLVQPGRVVERVAAAHARALARPVHERRWTAEWPPGWTPWW